MVSSLEFKTGRAPCAVSVRIVRWSLLLGAALLLVIGDGTAAVAGWSVKPDPPAEVTSVDLPETFDIPVHNEQVLYPHTASPFVAVVNAGSPQETILWELPTRRQVRRAGVAFDSSQSALSPDGKWLASSQIVNGKRQVSIYSFATGLQHKTLAFEQVDYLAFTAKSHLVVLGRKNLKANLSVWNPESGEVVGSNDFDFEASKDSLALSPGGRLIALVRRNKNELIFIDTEVQAIALKDELPKPKVGFWHECDGLRFSPDGRELAAIMRVGRESSLWVWDLEKGERVADIPLGDGLVRGTFGSVAYRGPTFEWHPNGKSWLLCGASILHRDLGRIVWKIQSELSDFAPPERRFLSPSALLVCVGSPGKRQIRTLKIDWETIETRLKQAVEDASAPLRIGSAVKIMVEAKDVRFAEKDKTAAMLRDALSGMIASQKLSVNDEGTVELSMEYTELQGQPMNVNPSSGLPNGGNKEDGGTGSGFVVTKDGYVVTCEHVIRGKEKVAVRLGEKMYSGTVLQKDDKLDLALLKVDAKDLSPVPFFDSDNVELGEEVRAIGFPLSNDLGDSLKATRGTIAGFIKKPDGRKLLQVDASINPGNSGGPVVNERAGVVGVSASKIVASNVDNVGFTIPSKVVMTWLKEHKVEFGTEVSATKLDGVSLVKRVRDSVVFIQRNQRLVDLAKNGLPEKVNNTRIEAEMTLKVRGQEKPVWKAKLVAAPNFVTVKGPMSDATVRGAVFDMFVRNLKGVSVPFYISQGPNPAILPGVSDLAALPKP